MISRHKYKMIVAAVAGSLCVAGFSSAQAPSAATPSAPSPNAAAPVQQTPIPAPRAAIPNPSTPSTTSPSAMTPPPSPAGSTTMQNPSLAASPIQMPSAVPNKAETAPSAFDKLATSGSTFVTKQETERIAGFDRAFSEADRDKDGKLTKDEFNLAWSIYTGRT